jgi:hypothetical protein
MFQIQKAQANNVFLTLTEKTTLDPVTYLFEFTNDLSKDPVYCIASDVSTEKQRYNKFVITETASPNALLGEVELELTRFYKYKVFEQAGGSINLDPTGLDVVEVGKMYVPGENVNTAYDDQTKTNYVYNG